MKQKWVKFTSGSKPPRPSDIVVADLNGVGEIGPVHASKIKWGLPAKSHGAVRRYYIVGQESDAIPPELRIDL